MQDENKCGHDLFQVGAGQGLLTSFILDWMPIR